MFDNIKRCHVGYIYYSPGLTFSPSYNSSLDSSPLDVLPPHSSCFGSWDSLAVRTILRRWPPTSWRRIRGGRPIIAVYIRRRGRILCRVISTSGLGYSRDFAEERLEECKNPGIGDGRFVGSGRVNEVHIS